MKMYEIEKLFPDKNFAEAVISSFGFQLPENYRYISESQLLEIGYLEVDGCSNTKIKSLEGIQHLTNLNDLYLTNHEITDLTPISNLLKLRYLGFEYNSIQEISALSKLTNLKTLSLDNNNISDISYLENLEKLNFLSIKDNQISDLSSISNLKELGFLDLTNNNISDISALSKLTNIHHLQLTGQKIENLCPLSNLHKLKSLTFVLNFGLTTKSRDFTVAKIRDNGKILSNTKKLNSFTKYYPKLSDYSFVSNLSKLEELRFVKRVDKRP